MDRPIKAGVQLAPLAPTEIKPAREYGRIHLDFEHVEIPYSNPTPRKHQIFVEKQGGKKARETTTGKQFRKRSGWPMRVRKLRVKLFHGSILGYLRRFRRSCVYMARLASTAAYRMDLRQQVATRDLPGSRQGVLAKLHFPSNESRRIHSVQTSASDDRAPLLHRNRSGDSLQE